MSETKAGASCNKWSRVGLLLGVLAGTGACNPIVGEPIGKGDTEQQQTEEPSGPAMMNAEEAQTWCEWYVTTAYPSAPYVPVPSPVEDGHADLYGVLYCWGGPWPEGACLMHPTVEHCVQNILHTWCEASVSALNDCVLGMITGNADSSGPCPVPGSCDAFFAAPGCDETVVLPMNNLDGAGGSSNWGCSLRVE